MWTHDYVSEKLRQLEEERLNRVRIARVRQTLPRRATASGRLAAVTGRFLRRVGETMEYWATPAGQRAQTDG